LATTESEKEVRFLVDKIFSAIDSDGSGDWSFDEVKEMLVQMARQQMIAKG
jgi:hypothetical protein